MDNPSLSGGQAGERFSDGDKEPSNEKGKVHLRHPKGTSGDLREEGEAGAKKNVTYGAHRVAETTAAPRAGAVQGVPPRDCQGTTNVLGRARIAQQEVRQSRIAGAQDNGEGPQVVWSHFSPSSSSGEGQHTETVESIVGLTQTGTVRATRDEQEISVDNSAPGWAQSDHRTGSQEQ